MACCRPHIHLSTSTTWLLDSSDPRRARVFTSCDLHSLVCTARAVRRTAHGTRRMVRLVPAPCAATWRDGVSSAASSSASALRYTVPAPFSPGAFLQTLVSASFTAQTRPTCHLCRSGARRLPPATQHSATAAPLFFFVYVVPHSACLPVAVFCASPPSWPSAHRDRLGTSRACRPPPCRVWGGVLWRLPAAPVPAVARDTSAASPATTFVVGVGVTRNTEMSLLITIVFRHHFLVFLFQSNRNSFYRNCL